MIVAQFRLGSGFQVDLFIADKAGGYKMTDMNEAWQAAKAERGDKAFELFMIYHHGYGDCDAVSNKQVEDLTINQNPDGEWKNKLRLKPIVDTVNLDIARYGKFAYLMYRDMTSNTHLFDIIHQDANGTTERKLYANVPFNIEWAKAGLAVDGLFFGKWCALKRTVEFVQEFDSSKIVGVDSVQLSTERLRHPFLPVIQ